MPSDTIYGLSCRALDEQAVSRIYELKKRDFKKPNIVLIAHLGQLADLRVDEKQAELVEEYWPGPLSLEFKAPDAPGWLHRGTKAFAIRMPASEELRELILEVGPIISTSANIQGENPAKSAQEAMAYFGEGLDFIVDVGIISNPPSTLVVERDGKLVVEREGAIKI